MYLFRGRHYDHKSRPQIRLMLWKPPPPIYPPLIQRVPEGLLREEVDAMRKAGHDLPALCRLGKHWEQNWGFGYQVFMQYPFFKILKADLLRRGVGV